MNDTDDLITQLHDRLTRRADEIDAPAGLADQARRGAHRRVARRAAIGGVPTLLAAALAVGLVTTGHSSRPSSGVDAAYIAEHVTAQLNQLDAGRAVLFQVTTNLPGATDAGQRTTNWDYYRPHSDRSISFARTTDSHGRLLLVTRDVLRIDHRHANDSTRIVNPIKQSWSQGTSSYTIPRDPGPGFFANDTQLRHLITRGAFTRAGTTTLAGQRALRLRLKLSAKYKKTEAEVLYVNARTYRPIEQITTAHEGTERFTETTDWRAATSANRVEATRSLPVPAGYRKVLSPAQASNRITEENIRFKLRHTTSPHERRLLHHDLTELRGCS